MKGFASSIATESEYEDEFDHDFGTRRMVDGRNRPLNMSAKYQTKITQMTQIIGPSVFATFLSVSVEFVCSQR
jgi:hypothetical protein